eukprot:2715271-Amphidinium_carterae.1
MHRYTPPRAVEGAWQRAGPPYHREPSVHLSKQVGLRESVRTTIARLVSYSRHKHLLRARMTERRAPSMVVADQEPHTAPLSSAIRATEPLKHGYCHSTRDSMLSLVFFVAIKFKTRRNLGQAHLHSDLTACGSCLRRRKP